jgi:hypothetical protein
MPLQPSSTAIHKVSDQPNPIPMDVYQVPNPASMVVCQPATTASMAVPKVSLTCRFFQAIRRRHKTSTTALIDSRQDLTTSECIVSRPPNQEILEECMVRHPPHA